MYKMFVRLGTAHLTHKAINGIIAYMYNGASVVLYLEDTVLTVFFEEERDDADIMLCKLLDDKFVNLFNDGIYFRARLIKEITGIAVDVKPYKEKYAMYNNGINCIGFKILLGRISLSLPLSVKKSSRPLEQYQKKITTYAKIVADYIISEQRSSERRTAKEVLTRRLPDDCINAVRIFL